MNDFFASLFEVGGLVRNDFSDSLYDYGLYTTAGLVMVFGTLAAVVIYYYGINSPKFNKIRDWLLVNAVSGFLIALFAFFTSRSKFTFEELGFLFGDYIQFALIVFVFSIIVFSLLSLLLKHWSVNAKDSPIRTRK